MNYLQKASEPCPPTLEQPVCLPATLITGNLWVSIFSCNPVSIIPSTPLNKLFMRFRLFSICPAVLLMVTRAGPNNFARNHGLSLIRIPHPFELNLFYKRDIHELSLQSPDALFSSFIRGMGYSCARDKKVE